MKKILLTLLLLSFAATHVNAQNKNSGAREIDVTIDLNVVKDDKVKVSVSTPQTASETITYHIPKIIPGTYSADDYGKFITDFTAIDKNGKSLQVAKADENSWTISNAKNLDKITYWVNDTYDIEDEHDIFSPAGTNILANTNFMLNMHGFVGYYKDQVSNPYRVTVNHPAALFGATSLVDNNASATADVFTVARYADLVDNPIMYSKADYTTFKVGDMEILLSVYSPTGAFDAKSIFPEIERMMQAQKKFLGPANNNKKYTILLYLSNMQEADAQGFGALEHNTSTTVLFPELMPREQLIQGLIDVVSHEFFHIVTPLGVHSEEIHNFDFNNPKMSQHLWMYEGITEYFANLFQVNQGLITEDEFYTRMADKMANASRMNDKMSFTEMSANVLKEPYKSQYLNVYEKGALIGMCLDIIIREKSNGQRGVLDLMQKLSSEYGPTRPFKDKELFSKIVALTYPEVGTFLNTYVSGTTPIAYEQFLARVGVTKTKRQVPENVFLKDEKPYVTIKPGTKDIVVLNGIPLNIFFTTLGIKGGDVIKTINGTSYNLDNIYDMVMASSEWNQGDAITMTVIRDGSEMTIKGKVQPEFTETEGYIATDASKAALREKWLRG